ncbi:MAG: HEAT repeat domain-containing protein [Bryobacteraceae bacterium]|nr:HEAT repeat domain-containing protein [Bryobacteraceae bacterium]
MTCETARENLALYLYQELSQADEEALETHLDGCEACRLELSRERALNQAMDEARPEPPPAALLAACREDLRREIARQPAPSWWERTRRELAVYATGLRLNPAAALALVAVGFTCARLWDAATVSAPQLHVRAVSPAGDGGVSLVVEEVRRKTLHGRLDDEFVRGLVLSAVRDASDPELRVRTLDLLKDSTDSADVRRAMLAALSRDPVAEVRMKAIEGLRPFAHQPEAKRVLSRVLLDDENPGVRTGAIDALLDHFENGSIGTLQEVVMREQNPYIRQRSVQALRRMRASVEPF